jgi:hypothetical protein
MVSFTSSVTLLCNHFAAVYQQLQLCWHHEYPASLSTYSARLLRACCTLLQVWAQQIPVSTKTPSQSNSLLSRSLWLQSTATDKFDSSHDTGTFSVLLAAGPLLSILFAEVMASLQLLSLTMCILSRMLAVQFQCARDIYRSRMMTELWRSCHILRKDRIRVF